MNASIFEIYCGGKFIKTSVPWEVNSPFDGSIAGRTFLAGPDELDSAFKAAQDVVGILASLPSFQKYKILMQISSQLFALRQQFAEIISAESGKPIKYALSEVDRSIQTFVIAAEECKRIQTEYISMDWTSAGLAKEGLVKYFPIGIVAGISPFNFPLNLAVHKIAPAIAAGCPVILKPSSSTPLSTLFLAQVISQTELPLGSVSILPMNRQTGNLLVTHPQIALLSFTGSPEVGWKMKADAGKKKVILELGGNAGAIIATSDNITKTVQKCVSGSFSYSGQVCIHTQRIYVLNSLWDEFIALFVEETQ